MAIKNINKKRLLLFSLSAILFTVVALPVQGEEVFEVQVLNDSRPRANIQTPRPFMACDNWNNIYITGAGMWDINFTTMKYDPNGTVLWTANYDGPANWLDYVTALAVDDLGNAYVTGRSEGDGTEDDYATVKYAPDSNVPIWVARYNGLGNDRDRPSAIAVDSTGNVYVTGYSEGSGTEKDCVTIKYDPNGNELWVGIYNGPGDNDDSGRAIALDTEENIYVTGSSMGEGTNDDYLTIKYAPDSNVPIWIARYDGPAHSDDYARDIAIDDQNNIYVTGSSGTIKYVADSNQPVWVSTGNSASLITLDGDGNILVTNTNWKVVKYDPNGNELWVARYNSEQNGDDYVTDIATDSLNNVYVTGSIYVMGSPGLLYDVRDAVTIKYGPDSNEPLWIAEYQKPGMSITSGDITIDSLNHVYICGCSYSLNPRAFGGEQFITKYKQCEQSGDVDCDGDVELLDFDILSKHWLENDCGKCGGAEITGDGDVDSNDFNKMGNNWLAGAE